MEVDIQEGRRKRSAGEGQTTRRARDPSHEDKETAQKRRQNTMSLQYCRTFILNILLAGSL
jgi:hypothetical protein